MTVTMHLAFQFDPTDQKDMSLITSLMAFVQTQLPAAPATALSLVPNTPVTAAPTPVAPPAPASVSNTPAAAPAGGYQFAPAAESNALHVQAAAVAAEAQYPGANTPIPASPSEAATAESAAGSATKLRGDNAQNVANDLMRRVDLTNSLDELRTLGTETKSVFERLPKKTQDMVLAHAEQRKQRFAALAAGAPAVTAPTVHAAPAISINPAPAAPIPAPPIAQPAPQFSQPAASFGHIPSAPAAQPPIAPVTAALVSNVQAGVGVGAPQTVQKIANDYTVHNLQGQNVMTSRNAYEAAQALVTELAKTFTAHDVTGLLRVNQEMMDRFPLDLRQQFDSIVNERHIKIMAGEIGPQPGLAPLPAAQKVYTVEDCQAAMQACIKEISFPMLQQRFRTLGITTMQDIPNNPNNYYEAFLVLSSGTSLDPQRPATV